MVFYPCTDDPGGSKLDSPRSSVRGRKGPSEEMGMRSLKLTTADESTVAVEPHLDGIAVKDSEGDRCFPYSCCTDESEGFAVSPSISSISPVQGEVIHRVYL
jgi:hypothetical protein